MTRTDRNPPARVGRPPVELEPGERQRLTAMGALGLNRELAAARLGISPTTLRSILRRDEEAEVAWLMGRAEAAEEALSLLWKAARAGQPAAQIFLGKTLAGLRETGAFEDGGAGGGAAVSVTFNVVAPSGELRELRRVPPPGEWTSGEDGDGEAGSRADAA